MGSYIDGVKEPLPDIIHVVTKSPVGDTTIEPGTTARFIQSFVLNPGCVLTLTSSAEFWVGF